MMAIRAERNAIANYVFGRLFMKLRRASSWLVPARQRRLGEPTAGVASSVARIVAVPSRPAESIHLPLSQTNAIWTRCTLWRRLAITRTLIHSQARGNSPLSEIVSFACVSLTVDYIPLSYPSRARSTSAFALCAHSYKGSNLSITWCLQQQNR
jgi:hypothetical protein